MKAAVVFIVASLTLSFAACSSSQNASQNAATTAPETMAAATTTPAAMMGGNKMAKSVSVTMNAQSGSGETGTATLTAKGAKTMVVVSLTGEAAGADQPAHIHPGSCAKLNPIPKYVLKDVVGGKSTTTVAAPLASLTTGHWAINVHDSAKNLKKYVSCGDIPGAGM